MPSATSPLPNTIQFTEGRISRLFSYPQGGQGMFELDEGARRSRWVRQGDESWYALGWRASIEHVVFHAPAPVGDVQFVTRIWIGNSTAGSLAG